MALGVGVEFGVGVGVGGGVICIWGCGEGWTVRDWEIKGGKSTTNDHAALVVN